MKGAARGPALLLALAIAALAAAARQDAPEGAGSDEPALLSEREIRLALQLSPLPPLPPDPSNRYADDPAAARLGQHLFFDKGLSREGSIACSTCHDPAQDFSDGKPLAEGLAPGTRRTPSLWDVARSRWLFWDGRADTLWGQALQPLESSAEMDGDRLSIARHLAADPALAAAYESIFGPLPALPSAERARPVPEDEEDPRHRAWLALAEEERRAIERVLVNVGKALGAYQRRLARGGSPFDRFVEGLREGDAEKKRALSDEALRGLRLFLGRGQCRTCHAGPTFSDGEFHDLALPRPDGTLPRDPGRYGGIRALLADPFNAAGEHADAGREAARERLDALLLDAEHWGEFKTPSLRNAAREGPFMHAGQFGTLEEVLRFYSTREGAAPVHRHRELVLEPLELGEGELGDLAAFLRSLAGRPLHPDAVRPLDFRAGG